VSEQANAGKAGLQKMVLEKLDNHTQKNKLASLNYTTYKN